MYAHNEKVAEEMKANILTKWSELIKEHKVRLEMFSDWSIISEDEDIVKLQKLVCYSGYGTGYTIKDVEEEFFNELDMMANWQLHQEYGWGVQQGLLPKVKFPMLGHGSDEDYYIEQSLELK